MKWAMIQHLHKWVKDAKIVLGTSRDWCKADNSVGISDVNDSYRIFTLLKVYSANVFVNS